MAQPLVMDGTMKHGQFAKVVLALSSSFITHTPLVIYDNSIIIAATHPNTQRSAPTRDARFLSDFYAFNYLLKGSGSS
jgi:hypothetical protein